MANTYADKLRDPRWQAKRLDVLNRDSFTCQMCNDTKTELHIHHFCYPASKNPWESDLSELITYCKHCHLAVGTIENHIEAIRKIDLDSTKTLLICFPYEAALIFLVYDNKKNQISSTNHIQYHYGKNLILPYNTPQEWQCKACGHENFNNTKCRVCGWIVQEKSLQNGE